MAHDLPTMTRQGRKGRQEAWQAGWDWARAQGIDGQAIGTVEESVEYLRGIGQYFNALAHDLTQARQEQR